MTVQTVASYCSAPSMKKTHEFVTEVLPAETGRAQFVKQRLRDINTLHNDLIIENGLLLREYQANAYFKEDGFKSFDEAIEALHERGELDYGARNARHFIAIINMVEALNIGPEEVKAIGVSKLREIASLKDSQSQLALLGAAAQKSVGEIQKEAKRLRDKAAGRETDPLNPITLMMTDTQKQFYKECIERGRLLSGAKDEVPEVAILVDVILADWFSGAADAHSDPAEV